VKTFALICLKVILRYSQLISSSRVVKVLREDQVDSQVTSAEKIDINNVPLVTRVPSNLFPYEYPKRHPFLPPEDCRSRCLLTRVGVV